MLDEMTFLKPFEIWKPYEDLLFFNSRNVFCFPVINAQVMSTLTRTSIGGKLKQHKMINNLLIKVSSNINPLFLKNDQSKIYSEFKRKSFDKWIIEICIMHYFALWKKLFISNFFTDVLLNLLLSFHFICVFYIPWKVIGTESIVYW